MDPDPLSHKNPRVEILPLRQEHLDAVTEIHLEAYRDQINFSQLLGAPFVRRTYQWFCEAPDRFGFVALIDGEPGGFIVGSEFAPDGRLNRSRLVTAILQALIHPQILTSKMVWQGLLRKITSPPHEDREWQVTIVEGDYIYLYSLAVLAKYAPLRIARLLLSACEGYAKGAGRRLVLASVGADNLPSLTLYRWMRYTVDPQKSDDVDKYFYKYLDVT